MKNLTIVCICCLILIFVLSCDKESSGYTGDGFDLTGLTHDPTSYEFITPDFFPDIEQPSDNITTVEGVELGRHLFYDTQLSLSGGTSCASCHQPENNFSNNLDLAIGDDGMPNARSTMTLTNAVFVRPGYFYDGRAATLEDATFEELQNPNKNGALQTPFLNYLRENAHYRQLFRAAFPIEHTDEITNDLVVKALAQFQRSLVSANNKLDQAQTNGSGVALTNSETNGYFKFFQELNFTLHPGCSHCHESNVFDGEGFYNNGLDEAVTLEDFTDLGRGGATGNPNENGQFRAPTLRNIALTAPYMHDGRFETLEEVIDHYQSGGHPAPNLDQEITGFPLTEIEKQELLDFLYTLTDQDFINNSENKSPF